MDRVSIIINVLTVLFPLGTSFAPNHNYGQSFRRFRSVRGSSVSDLYPPPSAQREKPSSTTALDEAAKVVIACAGLDRGAVATSSDIRRVNMAVTTFEIFSQAELPLRGDALVAALTGRWRLIYSSTFARDASLTPSGVLSQGFAGTPTLGGADFTLFKNPFKQEQSKSTNDRGSTSGRSGSSDGGGGSGGLGAVFQDIRPGLLDNCVEFSLQSPIPFAPPLMLRARLKHRLAVVDPDPLEDDDDIDKSVRPSVMAPPQPSKLRIVYDETSVRVVGAGQASRYLRTSIPSPRAAVEAFTSALSNTSEGSSAAEAAFSSFPDQESILAYVPEPLQSTLREAASGLLDPLVDAEAKASTFQVTALAPLLGDGSSEGEPAVRVSRSGLGELRVFVRS
mmetsp:Transcript_33199/g.66165  ORF Transcript_33199/g.66165 Transcript_33199/m.66165 type:complete len:394 (+) Transcript_33199:87-1268(+)